MLGDNPDWLDQGLDGSLGVSGSNQRFRNASSMPFANSSFSRSRRALFARFPDDWPDRRPCVERDARQRRRTMRRGRPPKQVGDFPRSTATSTHS
jgi:hypothetical protein